MAEVVLQLKMIEPSRGAQRFGHRVAQGVGAPFGRIVSGALGGFMYPAVQAAGRDVRARGAAGQKVGSVAAGCVQLGPQCAARGLAVDRDRVIAAAFDSDGDGPAGGVYVFAQDRGGRRAAQREVVHQAKGGALGGGAQVCADRFYRFDRVAPVVAGSVRVSRFWGAYERGGVVDPLAARVKELMPRSGAGEFYPDCCGAQLEGLQVRCIGAQVAKCGGQDGQVAGAQIGSVLAGGGFVGFEGVGRRAAYVSVEGDPVCQVVLHRDCIGISAKSCNRITRSHVECVCRACYCLGAGNAGLTCDSRASGFLAEMQDNPDHQVFFDSQVKAARRLVHQTAGRGISRTCGTGLPINPSKLHGQGDDMRGMVSNGADSRARETVRTREVGEFLADCAERMFDAETALIAEMNRKTVTPARRELLTETALQIYRATANVRKAQNSLTKAVQA